MTQKKWQLEQQLRDQKMRRALLQLLQEMTAEDRPGGPAWPEPMLDDDQVEEHLKRILRFGPRWRLF